ncbi:DUF4198 domain-containing protein [Octadecabacter sp.]|nr:DUF4198 domain-containing protein [Octadecabacter sp.]
MVPGKQIFLPLVMALAVLGSATSGHEFWIEPQGSAFDITDPVVADIRVGQDFSGASLPFTSQVIETIQHGYAGMLTPVQPREGDRPAVTFTPDQAGLHTVIVETNPAYIVFDDLDEFSDYLAYKGLSDTLAQHLDRGLPETEIAEGYIRNAKALVQVGPYEDGQTDQPTGLPLEIVALGSPYAPQTSPLEFEVTWQNAPVAGIQIAVFHLSGDGTAPDDTIRETVVTDANGRAVVDVSDAGSYLLNAVRISPVEGPGSVRWESYWASLTFDTGA